MALSTGLYEQLITEFLDTDLRELEESLVVQRDKIDSGARKQNGGGQEKGCGLQYSLRCHIHFLDRDSFPIQDYVSAGRNVPFLLSNSVESFSSERGVLF